MESESPSNLILFSTKSEMMHVFVLSLYKKKSMDGAENIHVRYLFQQIQTNQCLGVVSTV